MWNPLDDRPKLERYEVISELASGGMATVYLGKRGGAGGFQRLVAIKRLHPHLARDPEFVDMFLDEARVAARIHHPNVVPILDIETGSAYCLVMEYIEGNTLGHLLGRSLQQGKHLPLPVVTRILLDALAGLHAAHELADDDGRALALVHRDVSPQNILVGADGVSRLTDFGVAHAATRLTSTRTGQLKGKLAYMSPEQALGSKVALVDRRADVFAMGIVLWESLASARLFRGDGDAETLNRVLYEPIPLLGSVAPSVPASLEVICARALDRDLASRYASAAEMARDLEQAARIGGFLGTQRDVGDYVESVLGEDMTSFRGAVREWLARKDGAPATPDARVAIAAALPMLESGMHLDGRVRVGDEHKVASVSSAVISVSPDAPSTRRAAPTTRSPVTRGATAWKWGAVAATAVTLIVVSLVASFRHGTPVAGVMAGVAVGPNKVVAAAAAPLLDPVKPTVVAAVAVAREADEPLIATAATAATAATTAGERKVGEPAARPVAGPTRPHRERPRRAAASLVPAAPAGEAVPDDIATNPYR